MRYSISFILLLAFFWGCGPVEEIDSGTVEYENEDYEPNQNNICYDNYENAAGCFGTKQYFGDEEVTEGIWSVYSKSNNYLEYYDKYQYSYQFFSDGSLKQRVDTKNYYYSQTDVWGINTDGSVLTVHPTTGFTITASRSGSCYTVTSSSDTYRMCNEPFISGASQNDSGYYGSNLSFGNNVQYGDYTVVGTWTIDSVEIELDENGSTSNGGEWGLSQDAKVITIDGISYLVNKYPDDGCIDTYEMNGDYATNPAKLCKL